MNTGVSTNWQAIFYVVLSAVTQMPDNTIKHSLLGLGMLCMAAICYFTRGSGLTEAQGQKLLDVSQGMHNRHPECGSGCHGGPEYYERKHG